MLLGLSPPGFWEITPRELLAIMEGASEREFRLKRIEDGRTYMLACLIGFAVNDPRRIPKFEDAFPDGRPKPEQTPDEIFDLMVGWVETMNHAEAQSDGS